VEFCTLTKNSNVLKMNYADPELFSSGGSSVVMTTYRFAISDDYYSTCCLPINCVESIYNGNRSWFNCYRSEM